MEQKRIIWLDYARVFAILCVVLCHATETYYRPAVIGEAQISTQAWVIQNTLFTIGRLGVPVFLGITGTLFLNKELEVRRFYIHHLLPLLLTTEIWEALNYLFYIWINKQEFHWPTMVRMMLFLEQNSLGHMWYMPMILSYYVAMPFLSWIVQRMKTGKEHRLWLLVGFLTMVAAPTVNVFLKEAFSEITLLDVRAETAAFGGVYLLYLFLGYRLGRKEALGKIPVFFVAFLGIAAFVWNSIGQRYLYMNGFFKTKLLTYESAGIFIAGLCSFELLRRMFRRKETCGKIISTISHTSFGIFLLHKPLQVYLERRHMKLLVEKLPLLDHETVRIGILFLASFLISYLAVLLVTLLVPPLGQILFYSKSFYKKKRERR